MRYPLSARGREGIARFYMMALGNPPGPAAALEVGAEVWQALELENRAGISARFDYLEEITRRAITARNRSEVAR